jgi:four helix bundle protein
MNQEELKKRTKKFTIDCIRFVKQLPNGKDAWIIGDQLYRAGSAVGANYRAACRSKTRATFIHKLGIVEEEADECCFWLEVCLEIGIGEKGAVESLYKEANELTSIFTSANKTLYNKMRQ